MDSKKRCSWAGSDPLYIAYHDTEWGRPEHNNLKLFEKICLEGQQAGLSWITVLRKREAYRQAFHHFDPEKIAAMTAQDIDLLMENAGLIRHRGKLEAIVKNARAYLAMQENNEDLAELVWQFAPKNPPIPQSIDAVPTQTPESEALCRALKKRGFAFIGATSCYAFMQAMGLVNDHMADCFCRHSDEQSGK